MYPSFRIQNFRCFEELALDDLARINLIAGKNNVGKTTLLQAIWLFSGYYGESLKYILEYVPEKTLHSLDNLFYRFNIKENITIKSLSNVLFIRFENVTSEQDVSDDEILADFEPADLQILYDVPHKSDSKIA
jgi:AAA15 family ATPase/GTPase